MGTESSLRSRTGQRGALRATAWVFAGRIATRALGLAQVALFARLLGPESFSLVAKAILVVGILELMTEQGLGTALIQKSGSIDRLLPTVWVANVVRGIVLCAVLALCRHPVAGAFQQPDSAPYIGVMGLMCLVNGFENLASITFGRELNFRPLVINETVAAIVRLCAGCIAWSLGADAWCIVIAAVAGAGSTVVGSYLIMPRFHGVGFRWEDYRELNRFGVWIMVSRYASMTLTKGCGVAIGLLTPPVMLGFYTNADQLVSAATLEISNMAGKVLVPGLSRAHGDAARFRDAFERAFSGIACVSIAVAMVFIGSSDAAVRIVLGDSWSPAVPMVPWIAVWGTSRALGACISHTFIAAGQPRSASSFQLVMVVLFLVGVYPVARHHGAVGICALLACIGTGVQGWRYPMIATLIGCSTWRVARLVIVPGVAAALSLATVRLLGRIGDSFPVIVRLIGGGSVGLMIYACLLHTGSSLLGFELPVIGLLRSRLTRRQSPVSAGQQS